MTEEVLNDYLRPPAAAAFINVSTSNLAKGRCYGTLDIPYKKIGRCVLYERKALEEWLKAKKTYLTTKEYQSK